VQSIQELLRLHDCWVTIEGMAVGPTARGVRDNKKGGGGASPSHPEQSRLVFEGHDLSAHDGGALLESHDVPYRGLALPLHRHHAGNLDDRILLCLREMALQRVIDSWSPLSCEDIDDSFLWTCPQSDGGIGQAC